MRNASKKTPLPEIETKTKGLVVRESIPNHQYLALCVYQLIVGGEWGGCYRVELVTSECTSVLWVYLSKSQPSLKRGNNKDDLICLLYLFTSLWSVCFKKKTGTEIKKIALSCYQIVYLKARIWIQLQASKKSDRPADRNLRRKQLSFSLL